MVCPAKPRGATWNRAGGWATFRAVSTRFFLGKTLGIARETTAIDFRNISYNDS